MKSKYLILVSVIFLLNQNIGRSQSPCIEDHKKGMLEKYKELDPIEGIWMTAECYVYKYINGQFAKKDNLTGTTTFDYMILLQPGQRFFMIKTDDCQIPYGFRGAATFRATSDPSVYIGQSPTQTFNVKRNGDKLTYRIKEDYKNIKKEFGRNAANTVDIEFEFNFIKTFPTAKDYNNFINK